MSARAKAVAAGAKEITLRQCSAMSMMRRYGQPMPPPELAEDALVAFKGRDGAP